MQLPAATPYLHSSPPAVLDLLATGTSSRSFSERVRALSFCRDLEQRILQQSGLCESHDSPHSTKASRLSVEEEREVAGEMLRQRHRFTEQLFAAARFRQAALTVIQNIYLFKNRRIFFAPCQEGPDMERQEALMLFSASPHHRSLPLAKTFQHSLLARVWNRIVTIQSPPEERDPAFVTLLEIVENLNTLRNIYILFTRGLVRTLVARTPLAPLAVSFEDATQIGAFGVARAAYRYHPSCGVRFSTFATHWIHREIQQQALNGRLIRISSNSVEAYAHAKKNRDIENQHKYLNLLTDSEVLPSSPMDRGREQTMEMKAPGPSPESQCEHRQLRTLLLDAIDSLLDHKKGDLLKRRFGLPPYQGREESVIDISKDLGVTRSSIYQLEESALKALNGHLRERI